MKHPDESWPMISEAVLRVIDDLAVQYPGQHIKMGPPLAELGWADIQAEYPVEACELLFRAQGRTLAQTDLLDTVILAELSALLPGSVEGIVMPTLSSTPQPGSDEHTVSGIVIGPLTGDISRSLAVPVRRPTGSVSLGIVRTDGLTGTKMDTFDPTAQWTLVSGPLDGPLVDATDEWGRAVAAAHRALATELISIADEALRIAVEHVGIRYQFGSAIGSFQSPRHLLATAKADLESARALLDETWRYGGGLSALAAKSAAGRAHRVVSDAAMQVCGATGLTAEHNLHRFVSRGFQIDSLFGSHHQLEASLAEHLFEIASPGRPLPALVALSD